MQVCKVGIHVCHGLWHLLIGKESFFLKVQYLSNERHFKKFACHHKRPKKKCACHMKGKNENMSITCKAKENWNAYNMKLQCTNFFDTKATIYAK